MTEKKTVAKRAPRKQKTEADKLTQAMELVQAIWIEQRMAGRETATALADSAIVALHGLRAQITSAEASEVKK